MHRKKILPFAALAGIALATTSAHAQLLVYEGFDYDGFAVGEYPVGDPNPSIGTDDPNSLHGNSGGTGLSGSWTENANTATSLWVAEGSLEFGDLLTTGNHVRYHNFRNNDIYTRAISSDLTATTTGEIWFSFLGAKLDTRSAAQEGLVIGNQTIGSSQIGNDDASTTGMRGFGIGSSNGGNWVAYGYGEGGTVSDGNFGISTGETNLLVGRISLALDEGEPVFNGVHTFTTWYYDLDGAGGSVVADMNNLVQIGQLGVEFDLAGIGILNITRQVNTAYDEIRIGLTLADVIPAGAPPASAFQVVITPNGDDFDFSWPSQADKLYDLVTSTDLADPISAWPVYNDGVTTYGDLAATPPTNTLTAVPGDGPKRFFAVVEKDAPPPAE